MLPLVAVRLQPHRSTLQHSRPLPATLPSPQQRGQPFTPITPLLKFTPLQPIGPFGWMSHLQSRLQHGSAADDLPVSQPQERGWIGAAAIVLFWQVKSWRLAVKSRFADSARHWKPDVHKRGGGLAHSQPLPATAVCRVSPEDLRTLMEDLPWTMRFELQKL